MTTGKDEAAGTAADTDVRPDGKCGPKILIVSVSIGAGHNQAARAVAEELRAAMPDSSVEIVDTLAFAPWFFRVWYFSGYLFLFTRLSWLYGLIFRLSNLRKSPRRGLIERIRLFQERVSLRRFAKYVRQSKPDLVINTHFLAPSIIGRMIRRGEYTGRQAVSATDVLLHRYWLSENVDRWFLPAEDSIKTLVGWGVDRDRITVSGMPIHPKWALPLDREKILAEWNLPTDRPIVLLACGGDVICGPVARIARDILDKCKEAFVIALAGRDKELLGQLARIPQAGKSLMGVPFTDRVHELVEICDLMVTKSGGLSTAECLSKGKAMVLLKPLPGQETGNAEHFVRNGAAIVATRNDEIGEMVARLLADRDTLGRMGAAARRLSRPGARTIAETVKEMLSREDAKAQN